MRVKRAQNSIHDAVLMITEKQMHKEITKDLNFSQTEIESVENHGARILTQIHETLWYRPFGTEDRSMRRRCIWNLRHKQLYVSILT